MYTVTPPNMRPHLRLIKYRGTEREKSKSLFATVFVIYLYILTKNISFIDTMIYYEYKENMKQYNINGFKELLLI